MFVLIAFVAVEFVVFLAVEQICLLYYFVLKRIVFSFITIILVCNFYHAVVLLSIKHVNKRPTKN